jgi:hypothetical protein
MDRERLQVLLETAERNVLSSLEQVVRQEQLVDRLRRGRLPTDQAKEVLAALQEAHGLLIADRDRLLRELGARP